MTMPTKQRFDTADVLVLEIERDPDVEAGELLNLVENPTGQYEQFGLSGYGWISPVAGSIAGWIDPPGQVGNWLQLNCFADQANYFWTEPAAITPTHWVGASYESSNDGLGIYSRARIQFLNYDYDEISSSPITGWHEAGGATVTVDPVEAPANAYYVRLQINVARTPDGDFIAAPGRALYVTDVRMAAHADPDAVEVPLPDIPSHYLDDLIELANSITVNRAPLDASTMTVTLLADALSANEIDGYGEGLYGETFYGGAVQFSGSSMRPGKNVRLTALVTEGPFPTKRQLFTGEVQSGRVDYDLTQPEGKRAKITLNCVDAVARLAAKRYNKAYSDAGEMRSYMEGLGVPWDVFAYTATDPAAPNEVTNDGSALDQVIRTRDTNAPLLVWIDQRGIFKVRDWDGYGGSLGGIYPDLSDEHYNGNVAVVYDTETVVNSVKVTLLHGTESKDFGPYERPASIVRWGRRPATYTALNSDEWDSIEARAFGDLLLDANHEPFLKVESATLPMLSRDVAAWAPGSIHWCALDLYDPVTLTNSSPEFEYDLQVTSVQHQITPEKWLTTYGFGKPGRAALPTKTR